MANSIAKLAREPLLHFLLLGAAIFVAYSLVSKTAGDVSGTIVISQGQVSSMMESFTRIRQRPPTQVEWDGLIRDRVREEVYYREAVALGLDKDDLIIRRRLRQKMEFISDNVADSAQPTDAELNAFLRAHQDSFHVPERFSFSQVFLDPSRHGDHLARDTARMLSRLKQDGPTAKISAIGDPFMLNHEFEMEPAGDVANLFGGKFAAKLSASSLGQWQPIESSYGMHLVLIRKRTEGGVPALEEVRDAVRREWESAQRSEAKEKLYRELLKRYVVTIEHPAEASKKIALTRQ